MKVPANCFSRSIRSVTTMTRQFASPSSSSRALHSSTIRLDFPDPVVCQITPPSRAPSRPRPASRASIAFTPNACW